MDALPDTGPNWPLVMSTPPTVLIWPWPLFRVMAAEGIELASRGS